LQPGRRSLALRPMPILTAEGPRSVDDGDVIAVYPGGSDASYMFATLVMADGTEIAGAIASDALARLKTDLADCLPPAA
jgi:hypothetical protein